MSVLRIAKPACIDELGSGHGLLEASAGTGKTYAIEHLVVEMLLTQGRRLSEILVVTFTRKAAAEMSARIHQRLVALGDATQDTAASGAAWLMDGQGRKTLRDAVHDFDHAPISTIHAFCQRILEEHALLTGRLPSSFDADLRGLFREAWHEVVREDFASPCDGRAVLEVLLELGTGLDHLEAWLWEAQRASDAITPPWNAEGVASARHALSRAFQAMPHDLTSWLSAVSRTSRKRLHDDLTRLRDGHTRTQDAFSAAYLLHFLEASKPLRKAAPFRDRAKHSGGLREFLECCSDVCDVVPSGDAIVLHTLLPLVHERFARKCHRLGALDHDGVLRETRDALSGPAAAPLLAKIRHKYRVALVDEFQDTDDTQWEIFRRIFVEGAPQTRCIVVGDPKQAIYSFRGGDIHTYFRARRELPGQRVALAANYRSSSAMVHAYNTMLGCEVDGVPFLGDGVVRYDHPVEARSRTQGAFDESGAEVAPVLVLRLDPDATRGHAQAMLRASIAHEVHRLVERPVCIRGDGQDRPLRYRDIMCLTLSHQEAEGMVSTLRAAGIPAAHYGASKLWAGPEAGDLSDLLRSLASPNDLSLRLKALRTAFLGVDLTDLADARSLSTSDVRLRTWRDWVSLAADRDWPALFCQLRIATSLNRKRMVSEEWERRVSIFDALLSQAHSLAVHECPDIRTLACHVFETWSSKSRQRTSSREDEDLMPAPLAEDAVRVMTVFAAKGLEAPVVCFAGGLSGESPSKERLHLYHDANGRRRVWAGPLPDDLKVQVEHERDAEARRLMYVLMTRPQVRLVLPLWHASGAKQVRVAARYKPLQDTLCQLESTGWPSWIDVRDVHDTVLPALPVDPDLALPDAPEGITTKWQSEARDVELTRQRAAGISFTSFTQLKPTFEGMPAAPTAAQVQRDDVPQGTHTGRVIHGMLERIPWQRGTDGIDFDTWRQQASVASFFRHEWRRNPWSAAQQQQAERWLYQALHAPVRLPTRDGASMGSSTLCSSESESLGLIVAGGLGALANQFYREVEFHIPLPVEAGHLLNQPVDPGLHRRWQYGRGVLKGAIDFVFECDGRVYLGDWKTNALADYSPAAVGQSVRATYEGQVRIYTLALMRLYGVNRRDAYDARIGGAIYVYLRGFDGQGNGVYAYRPTFDEIVELDRLLWEHNQTPHPVLWGADDRLPRTLFAAEAHEHDEGDDEDNHGSWEPWLSWEPSNHG